MSNILNAMRTSSRLSPSIGDFYCHSETKRLYPILFKDIYYIYITHGDITINIKLVNIELSGFSYNHRCIWADIRSNYE